MEIKLSRQYVFTDVDGNNINVRATAIDSKTGLHSFKPILPTISNLAPHLYRLVKVETITLSKEDVPKKIRPCS